MKNVLLMPIKIYWLCIPKSKRKCCIFRESCSNYVFNQTKEQGFVQGLKALWFRYNNCRPGYHILSIEEKVFLISVKNITFSESEIHPKILTN
ncbi:MAG: membrane protein insertion efficiency factor YidD [Marinirhabdus sp.]